MSTTFVSFTLDQIVSALPKNCEWVEIKRPSNQEIVFGSDIGDGWRCLVYTGLWKSSGVSRDAGEDTIRLVLLDTVSIKGVAKSTRIHRTGTVASLRARIQARLESLVKVMGSTPRCPDCGAAMVDRVRKRDKKKFKGCIQYDKCQADKVISGTENPESESQNEKISEPVSITPTIPPLSVVRVTEEVGTIDASHFPFLEFPFEKFNPVQSQVIQYLDEDTNLVVCAKTSAGKTVVAELFLSKSIYGDGDRGLFLSPLKAVTQEKYDEWQERFVNCNISIVTGDYQLTEKRKEELADAHLILLTSEMLDSRTRRMESENNYWLGQAGVLVCDESHLLTMPDRGHALESGIMRFTSLNPKARIILLSATMPNVESLGSWLTTLNGKQSRLIVSDWRPVPHETHFIPHQVMGNNWNFMTEAQIQKAKELVLEHGEDKWLMFVHSKAVGRKLSEELRKMGVANEFHNADLTLKDRLRIEAEFRKR